MNNKQASSSKPNRNCWKFNRVKRETVRYIAIIYVQNFSYWLEQTLFVLFFFIVFASSTEFSFNFQKLCTFLSITWKNRFVHYALALMAWWNWREWMDIVWALPKNNLASDVWLNCRIDFVAKHFNLKCHLLFHGIFWKGNFFPVGFCFVLFATISNRSFRAFSFTIRL